MSNKSIFNNKKGSGVPELGKFIPFVVTFLMAILVIVMSVLILAKIRDTATLNQMSTQVNQSLTWGGNNTAIGLNYAGNDLVSGTGQLYINGTLINSGGTNSAAGNWSVNYTYGLVYIYNNTNLSSIASCCNWVDLNTGTFNFSYQYFFGSSERNITKQGIQGLNITSSYSPIIAVILVVALVLGVVIASLYFLIIKRS